MKSIDSYTIDTKELISTPLMKTDARHKIDGSWNAFSFCQLDWYLKNEW